jgi:hypothetical protein
MSDTGNTRIGQKKGYTVQAFVTYGYEWSIFATFKKIYTCQLYYYCRNHMTEDTQKRKGKR